MSFYKTENAEKIRPEFGNSFHLIGWLAYEWRMNKKNPNLSSHNLQPVLSQLRLSLTVINEVHYSTVPGDISSRYDGMPATAAGTFRQFLFHNLLLINGTKTSAPFDRDIWCYCCVFVMKFTHFINLPTTVVICLFIWGERRVELGTILHSFFNWPLLSYATILG